MRKTLWLLAVTLLFSSNPSLLNAQEQPQASALKAHYDPDSPNADADGFVWPKKIKSGLQSPKAQAPTADTRHPTPKAQSSPALERASSARSTRPNYLAEYYRRPEKQPAVTTTEEKGSLGGMIMQLMGGLGLVLGLMILGSAGMKKFSMKGKWMGRRGQLWQVIETTPLGPKRTLYVTRFVDRILLLGGTDQQMNVLAEIQDPTLATAIESGDADFRRFLVPETLAPRQASSPEEKEETQEKPSLDVLPVPADRAPGASSAPPVPALKSTFSARA